MSADSDSIRQWCIEHGTFLVAREIMAHLAERADVEIVDDRDPLNVILHEKSS